MEDDKIVMIMDDGQEVEFTIIDTTVFQGNNYILVTDAPEDEDGECYVMKEVTGEDDEEAVFESIEDEKEADAVFSIFQEMLSGEIDIER